MHTAEAPVPAYGLGIDADMLQPLIASNGIVRIVGYRRGGKSTLAEMLTRQFRNVGVEVLHQTATRWLGDRPYQIGADDGDSTVDPEIAQALRKLERTQSAIWIVDDADVLIGYASDQALTTIGRKIRAGQFSMVLIRNRYVRENSTFGRREGILRARIPTLELEALSDAAAQQVCLSMMRGTDAPDRAAWLARYSGGVPGLIAELEAMVPAPHRDSERLHFELLRMAQARRRYLDLTSRSRSRLVAALVDQTLPPPSFLPLNLASEVGSLILAGMVHPSYWRRASPFRGDFWALVGGDSGAVRHTHLGDVELIALALEGMVIKAGLQQTMVSAMELEPDSDGSLALAFARALYCTRHAPELVMPLAELLAGQLGTIHLLALLEPEGLEGLDDSTEPLVLAAKLLERASRA